MILVTTFWMMSKIEICMTFPGFKMDKAGAGNEHDDDDDDETLAKMTRTDLLASSSILHILSTY